MLWKGCVSNERSGKDFEKGQLLQTCQGGIQAVYMAKERRIDPPIHISNYYFRYPRRRYCRDRLADPFRTAGDRALI